ncbi:MAG: dihydrodipicolinate synthase family protein, partial [Eubacteriales bacterium]|nr:dihydrodipicolinate synthase family protein [Eubacteriales bacterium]
MKRLKGMIAAMPTPFFADESIDFKGVERLAEHLIKGGLHGILVGGSTGEYSLMSMEERKNLIKTVCDVAKNRAYVIAGSSCHRPKDTIEMVQYAGKAGADFALVLPPYYMCTSSQGIIDYYRTIGENSEIGIVVYHYPTATGVSLSPELLVEISKLPNIAGVKDTAEMEHTSKLICTTKGKNFGIINGCEHLIMGTLASGGDGTMGIVHNLVPNLMRQIYDF